MQEPYQVIPYHTAEVFYGSPSLEQEIGIIEKTTYHDFLTYKANFMKTLKFKWLIQGHLDKQQALNICNLARSCIEYKHYDEDDLLQFNLMIKLPEKSVHNYERLNPIPEG